MEGSTEYFGFVLDSFNDKENALAFFTTPAGLRWDATVFNDAQGDFPVNLSWNTFWDVKTTITEQGWQAEMRIPFTSLRFQTDGDEVKMGFVTWRYMPSKNEQVTYPAMRNDLGPWSSWKPSRMQEIVLKGIEPRKPVYIAPYMLTGHQFQNELNDSDTEFIRNSDLKVEAGLDLKYSFTSNLTMDVTVNPDFAQVEADDQQVNLTRFSLFFPEKRLFFQERSSVFDVNTGGPNRLFYSRRIGLDDDEGPVRIYGGVRMIGRVGGWDLGLLDMQTESIGDLNSTNYGVVRLRRQVINPFTYIGGIVTNKVDTRGNYNTTTGVDGVFRLTTDDYVNVNYAQTFYNDLDISPFSASNAKMRINFERRKNLGFGYNLGFSRVGENYEPEMGFELREDYTRYGNRIWWSWIPGSDKRLLNHQVFISGSHVMNNGTRDVQSFMLGPGWSFNAKSGSFGNIQVNHQIENLTDTFTLGDVDILPGKYEFQVLSGSYASPFQKLVNVQTDLTVGKFFNGNQLVLGISPGWRISSSLDVGLNYFYNRVKFSETNEEFIAHLIRLRSNYMFSTKLSLSAFVQHNSGDRYSFGNIRLRYNPSEGNDLFIVWNLGVNSDLTREVPHYPRIESRAFIIKYTYTFVKS